jgi:hypothetical protein
MRRNTWSSSRARNKAGRSTVTQQQGPHFTLYSRSYCHLCEDMLAALHVFMARAGVPWTIEVIDVDSDSQLTDMFDELVPVLYGSVDATVATAANAAGVTTAAPAGQEICHFFLDEAAVEAYLVKHATRQHSQTGNE